MIDLNSRSRYLTPGVLLKVKTVSGSEIITEIINYKSGSDFIDTTFGLYHWNDVLEVYRKIEGCYYRDGVLCTTKCYESIYSNRDIQYAFRTIFGMIDLIQNGEEMLNDN